MIKHFCLIICLASSSLGWACILRVQLVDRAFELEPGLAFQTHLSSTAVDLDLDDEGLVAGVHRDVLGVSVGGSTLTVNRRT